MSGDKDIDDEIAAQDDMIDDDYGDATGEDEEFADEDWDSYDEEGGEGAEGGDDAAPRKKGMPKFNKILIAGALGLGLCVVAFTMLTSKPAPTPPGAGQQRPAGQQAQQGGNAGDIQRQRLNSASLSDSAPTTQRDVIYGRNREENVIAPTNDNVTDEGGLLNNPSEVHKIEEYRAQLEQELSAEEEAAAAAEEAAQTAVVTSDPGQDLPAATPQVVNQEPPMPVPGADSVLTPLPDATAEDSASVGLPRAQDLALSDSTTADALADAPVDAPVDAAPVVAEPAATAPSADVASLTEKVETLQGALDSQVAKVKELESTVQQLERALESRATEAPRASAPAKRKASSSGTTAAKKSTASVRWVLKSAQPGHAMVSRAGENEMRNVTVGDTLPGVGRVTQIYQSSTGWIVQGTDGRILQ